MRRRAQGRSLRCDPAKRSGSPPAALSRKVPRAYFRRKFCNSQGIAVTLMSEAGTAPFIRRRGADFVAGEPLLERGVRIGPGEIGLIAAANRASVNVVREPRVAVCTVGDELVAPGSTLRQGQSVDSATHALAGLIRRWGGVPRAALGPAG